ncbi:PH domain-like protein [Clathrospora elynae]|uniref:PH domain-like protein n=1 Tax=Clathrospora elynae TaxID=706981 RepID=A0A6A5SKD1_9PLEO|nr:PH domain-like protein [Clathrospora elynae]
MAPQRAKARASHPQPQPPPQPSDYETDAQPAVDVPLPPPRSNEELNFSVLRRVYPELLAIEHVTPYAALYTFNLETQQWEKVGVEGSLFICQLTPSPIGAERYCAIIYNRRGLENFYQELTSSDEMEISDPYVILQGDLVYGIWIFADPPPASTANCRVETAAKMMEIADRAKASREAIEPTPQAVEHDEAASSAPMGRQLSLRELFGQQPAPAQPDVLGQLFMKAKQNHNGLG